MLRFLDCSPTLVIGTRKIKPDYLIIFNLDGFVDRLFLTSRFIFKVNSEPESSPDPSQLADLQLFNFPNRN